MAKKEKEIVTNAIRIVRSADIPVTVHSYDSGGSFMDGVSVAKKMGQDPDCVFKTLVLRGHSGEYHVCCIPVAEELDLKKVAKAFSEKNIEMIPAKDITKITGYVKGGCSPVGMKHSFTTCIDETAQLFDTIIVSGGRLGLQMELSPEALVSITKGGYADLTKE